VKSFIYSEINTFGLPKFRKINFAFNSFVPIPVQEMVYLKAIQKITPMDVSVSGIINLGSVIGTGLFREQYIRNKVESWVKDLQSLSKYTQDDPQAVYSAFTKSLSSRWTHFQRTVPDASELFEPLEYAIRNRLIPALVGREVSDQGSHFWGICP